MQIVVAQFNGTREVNQIVCKSAEEARKIINDGNSAAVEQWRWDLSATTFVRDDGSEMGIDEANAIRRACGRNEY
jgi:hypothetical protein